MLSLIRVCPRLLMLQAASVSSLLKPVGYPLPISLPERNEVQASRYGVEPSYSSEEGGYSARGRNSRMPKRANHGKRPCSSLMRRLKNKMNYRRKGHGPDSTPDDPKTSEEDKDTEEHEVDTSDEEPEWENIGQEGEENRVGGEEEEKISKRNFLKKEEKPKLKKEESEDEDNKGRRQKGKRGRGKDSD